ncbi:hypothetical protein KL942_002711 [Ogataea angusta]|uniref:rRNA-processing protein CGR1 n=1 Tax=Pichia angusta TaxID=870730 RepID=A0ABQ7RSR2_PICAN|nr:hypothetical protein KL942_002711 [Ogataea angusta]KAG7846571.1 hypothetical protein KL940_004169 [Ogataea angusta]
MHRSWEKKQEQRLKDEQLKAKLKELQEEKEAEKRAKIERIKERRAKKEEKERYERLAAVMHAKKHRLGGVKKSHFYSSSIAFMIFLLYGTQMALGMLALSSILSYIVTNSFFWFSVPSKYLSPRYIADMTRGPREFTLEQLAAFNGIDRTLPVYISINGTVFDVTAARDEHYGPGCTYQAFSGRDCTRLFATGCFEHREQHTHDMRGLDNTEAAMRAARWLEYFANHPRYWRAGSVKLPECMGPPPPQCDSYNQKLSNK